MAAMQHTFQTGWHAYHWLASDLSMSRTSNLVTVSLGHLRLSPVMKGNLFTSACNTSCTGRDVAHTFPRLRHDGRKKHFALTKQVVHNNRRIETNVTNEFRSYGSYKR